MNAQKIIVATLSGLVAGVAIGMLTAPAEGKETRQRIADTADSFKKKLKQFRGVAMEELDELADIFEKEAQGLREDVRSRVLELVRSARTKGNHISKGNHITEQTLS